MVMGDRIKMVAQQAIREAEQGAGTVPPGHDDDTAAGEQPGHSVPAPQPAGEQAQDTADH